MSSKRVDWDTVLYLISEQQGSVWETYTNPDSTVGDYARSIQKSLSLVLVLSKGGWAKNCNYRYLQERIQKVTTMTAKTYLYEIWEVLEYHRRIAVHRYEQA